MIFSHVLYQLSYLAMVDFREQMRKSSISRGKSDALSRVLKTRDLPTHLVPRGERSSSSHTARCVPGSSFHVLDGTRQPSVPRMSEDWMRSHDVDRRRDLPW